MKIRLVESTYDSELGIVVFPLSDIMEVTEEEYSRLAACFDVKVLKDKDYFLEVADKVIASREKSKRDWEKKQEKRKAKAAATSEARKLKQLEKLKKELGIEDSIS